MQKKLLVRSILRRLTKPHFLNLVKNKLDITFANEQEIISLIDAKNFTSYKYFQNNLINYNYTKKVRLQLMVEVIESDIQKNLKLLILR